VEEGKKEKEKEKERKEGEMGGLSWLVPHTNIIIFSPL